MTNFEKAKNYDLHGMTNLLIKAALLGAKELCLLRGLPTDYYFDVKTKQDMIDALYPQIKEGLLKRAKETE